MKTTIDIAEPLLAEAKRYAVRNRTTVRALVEAGLRHVVQSSVPPGSFHLRDASVEGRGAQAGITEGDWAQIQTLIYAGRGA